MKNASRGDSVYDVRWRVLLSVRSQAGSAHAALHSQEDEDTLELEQRIAEMAGKEAALFCVSGTMVRLPSCSPSQCLTDLCTLSSQRPTNWPSGHTSTSLRTRS